jgi:hypothetical protein
MLSAAAKLLTICLLGHRAQSLPNKKSYSVLDRVNSLLTEPIASVPLRNVAYQDPKFV